MSERPGLLRPRNLALAAIGLAALATLVLVSSDSLRKSASLRAAEAIGNAAEDRMNRTSNLKPAPVAVRELAPGVQQAQGVANAHLIVTPEGSVLFDAGLSIQAAKQRRMLEEAVGPQTITHVILSHSHQDHAGGTPFWADEGAEIVAHRQFPEEQRYLKELEPFLWRRNRTLFPWLPEEPPQVGFLAFGHVEPSLLVDDGEPLRFEQGGVRFEVLPTPGAEGADNLSLWLPDRKILFTGDTLGPLFPQFPNVFTMRGEKVRKPIEYIATLDRLIALEPVLLVPSHGDPIDDPAAITAGLTRIRDAVQYVHDETIRGMNEGRPLYELMAEIQLPPEIDLVQHHGRVSWAVRSIWEYYATWFDFEHTTELYPVPPASVHADLVELAGVDRLVDRAQQYVDAERYVEALLLLDIVKSASPGHPGATRTRIAALQQLLSQAEQGLENTYEMQWLSTEIRIAEAQLRDGAAG